MIDGYRISQMIGVATELGIADLLAGGAKHHQELADTCGTNAPALYRLLRALASVGVFAELDGERFALNPLAGLLRANVPGSLRSWAIFGRRLYRAWDHLDHSIATGETAFDHIYGMSDWQYQEKHPEEGRVFNDAMRASVASVTPAIVDAYDFSRVGTIVDVGGGQGTLKLTRTVPTRSAFHILEAVAI